MALWDLILFQYLWGAHREGGPRLVTMVYSRTMRGYNWTETEKVLSEYKAHYEDNLAINEIIQRHYGIFILRGYSRADWTEP